MIEQSDLAGRFTLRGTSMSVKRMGYGAMQLAGPGVWGPPRDVEAAVAVLREAVESGVNHIDTSDYYGPHVTNQIIKRALHSYPDDLVIVTKLGARRGSDKSWIHALSPQELIDGAHDKGVLRLRVHKLPLRPQRPLCKSFSRWRPSRYIPIRSSPKSLPLPHIPARSWKRTAGCRRTLTSKETNLPRQLTSKIGIRVSRH